MQYNFDKKQRFSLFLAVMIGLLFSACSSTDSTVATSFPPSRGMFKVGKPYTVDGRTYTPELPATYKVSGISSWYGSDFHNKATANGEIFDKELLTAAHKTLPMPSIVRVTNINNGRSVVVRVNDRGPFVDTRLIDLSEASARALGFDKKGLAPVVVELLPQESYYTAIKAGARPQDVAVWNHGSTSGVAAVAAIPSPVKEPITKSTDGIYVQAGAFKSQQAADALAKNLQSSGLPNYGQGVPSVYSVPDNDLHKVRIGPLTSLSQADMVTQALISHGHRDVSLILP